MILKRNQLKNLSGIANLNESQLSTRYFSADSATVKVFLSHKHQDIDELYAVKRILENCGAEPYVDWLDKSMPKITNADTAANLKDKGYNEKEIQINEIKFKCRVPLKSLYLVVANDVVRYTDIKGEDEDRKDIVFYYVFVSKKNCKTADDIKAKRCELLDALRTPIEELYKEEKK